MSTLACAVAVALIAGLHAPSAWALALGRASVQSGLGEPLRAEIDVPSITPEEAASLNLRIGNPEAFRAAGMDMNVLLSDVQFTVVRRADGRTTIRLQSTRPVTEPFLDLIVEAEWAAGRLVRGYTMLFDPPALRAAQPAPAPLLPAIPPAAPRPLQPAPPATPAAPPATPQAVSPLPPLPQAAAPAPARPAPAPSPVPAPAPAPAARAAGAAEVLVRPGDTAGRIAAANKPASVSLEQMLVALLQNNPGAFVGDNVNRMKAGVVLNMPDAQQAAAVDASTARRTIAAQSRDFNEFRRRLAGATTTVPSAEASRESAGRIQTEVQDRAAAAPTPDRLTLSKGAAASAAAEAQIAQQRAQQDSSTRVAELSRNIDDLNKLQGAQPAGTAPAGSSAPAPSAAAPGVTPPAGVTAAAPSSTPSTPPAPPVVAAPPAPEAAPPAPPAAPPAASPAPVPAAAPAPAADSASGSGEMLQSLMDNPLVLPAAGGLAALLALLVLLRLRKKKDGEAGPSDDSRLQGESFFNASGSPPAQGEEAAAAGAASSMMYSPSQLDAAGDVDPVAEADVYLAYGRDAQAEEILKEAARMYPERVAVHSKLLEIYAKRGDKASMEAVASEIYALTNGAGDDWEHACRVAHPVDPDNTLYQLRGASRLSAATVSMPLAASELPAAMNASASDATVKAQANTGGLDLDLDFDDAPAATNSLITAPASTPDLDLPDLSSALPGDAAAELQPKPTLETAAAPEDDFSVDFDLDLTPPPAPPPAAATAADPQDDMGLDFELDLGVGGTPVAPQSVPAAVGESTEDQAIDFEAFNALANEPVQSPGAAFNAAPAGDPQPMEFDLGGLNLDLDPPATAAVASPADNIADPLETKLSLAEEFEAIGDTEGARSLAEEVRDEASGELKARAEAFLSGLA